MEITLAARAPKQNTIKAIKGAIKIGLKVKVFIPKNDISEIKKGCIMKIPMECFDKFLRRFIGKVGALSFLSMRNQTIVNNMTLGLNVS